MIVSAKSTRKSPCFPQDSPQRPLVVRFLFALGAVAALAVSAAHAQTNTFEEIEKQAQALSMRPFQPLDRQIPDAAAKLSYSEYRAIAFDRDKAIWNNTNLKFRIEAFFRGFLYPEKIQINLVGRNGTIQPLAYSSQLFKVTEAAARCPRSHRITGLPECGSFTNSPTRAVGRSWWCSRGRATFASPHRGRSSACPRAVSPSIRPIRRPRRNFPPFPSSGWLNQKRARKKLRCTRCSTARR